MLFSAWSVQSGYKEVFSSIEQLSEAERVQLKKSLFEIVVVEYWVEFWRWQSKVL
jgi:hypothetical protein